MTPMVLAAARDLGVGRERRVYHMYKRCGFFLYSAFEILSIYFDKNRVGRRGKHGWNRT
jgi:hypothetical protein